MKAIETTAHFDGKGELKIDNLPTIKNQNVKVLILIEENGQNDWYQFSANGLSSAYSNDEPQYTLNLIKEPNPDYKSTINND